MRLRPRTIRTQLLALLLVPMVSLAGLWTYSSYTTVRGALALIRVTGTYRYYGSPTDQVGQALQQERRAAVEYVASDGKQAGAALDAAERATDARATVWRTHVKHRANSATLTSEQGDRITELSDVLDGLPNLRAQVSARRTNWSDILARYSALIDPTFRLRNSLSELQTGEVASAGSVVIELGRARELLSREDAMVTGARQAGGMTDGQYRDFVGTIDGRKLLHEIYAPELPPDDAAKLAQFENGNVGWSLYWMELETRSAAPLTVLQDVPDDVWRQTADDALAQLGAIDEAASMHVGQQAHNTGMDVLLRAAAVSLAGLAAVVASLLISIRISRRIAGRLTALRDAAEELSGRRLPEIMLRLRDGDPVDEVEAEGQRSTLSLGADEIGQVGRAFGVAELAAVRATVEQARLRRGVAAVFTTLARRSQVLLHRQLTLLDTMERRTEDPDELADLFRLDHMTTRMRRHAEGLLILSGNAPGRAWRRPVRLAEVVRAAVGEVEDYRRITVRRMPRVALVGTAVGDVLHLLAELMENATAFSPPDALVIVDGEEVGGGFVIEIEDRGLGMSQERVEETNRELANAADGAELPENDRLGLFTVGRLAARHGVRVTLRRSPNEGTVAVVLIPHGLLVPVEEHSDQDTGEHRIESWAARAAGAGAVTRSSAESAARYAGPPSSSVAVADPPAAPGPSGPTVPVPARPSVSMTPAGLPRRVRQSNLAPQLKEEQLAHDRPSGEQPDGPGTRGGSDRERSPEAARSTMAAFARGLARGRSGQAGAVESTGEDGGSP